MKYSKELHKILDAFVKLNEENNPEGRLATVEETHALLYYHDISYSQVTHWMPLPEPPESEG